MFLKIGHRGAAGYAPENTLASIKKALDLKVDMIELDVRLCHSGEAVVIHDRKVNRTTNGHGYVNRKTLAELKLLTADGGEKIPTLEEALDLINKQTKVNIEIKNHRVALPVADLIKKYLREKGWSGELFLVSSSRRRGLKKFAKILPEIKIGIIIRENLLTYLFLKIFSPFLKFAEKIKAYSLHPQLKVITLFRFINKKSIKKIQQKGLKIFVWTVNKPEQIAQMKSLGVDGIFSDFPDRI